MVGVGVGGQDIDCRIVKKGLLNFISDVCCLCRREMKSIDHLFIHCDVGSSIWIYFLKEFGVYWCFLGSLAILFEAWKRSPLVGNGRILCRIIPFSILLSIWKERNDRIFSCLIWF